MKDLWERLGSWAAKNAGRALRLRKGASERSLALYVEALEKGDWVFSEKKGCVVPKKDKPDEYPNRADQFAVYARKKR